MGKCCGNINENAFKPDDPCNPPSSECSSGKPKAQNTASCPLTWFGNMIQNCYEYATDAKAKGRHIVGIMCEYTPRELIMAADGVPVCLCGGSADMIPPAEEHLPANLCPLIKSTYGYSVKKANPFIEMSDLIVAETTCDGKKKMYELMGLTRNVHILELPQKPDDEDAMSHWVNQLRSMKTKLEELFNVEITDTKIRHAIRTMNRERQLRRELSELMSTESPGITGRQLLDFKSSISGISADFHQYSNAIEMFKNRETKNTSSVRVLLTGVPVVHGASAFSILSSLMAGL